LIKNGLEIDWVMAERREITAYAIIGFGAITSYFFIIGCLIKYLGLHLLDLLNVQNL